MSNDPANQVEQDETEMTSTGEKVDIPAGAEIHRAKYVKHTLPCAT